MTVDSGSVSAGSASWVEQFSTDFSRAHATHAGFRDVIVSHSVYARRVHELQQQLQGLEKHLLVLQNEWTTSAEAQLIGDLQKKLHEAQVDAAERHRAVAEVSDVKLALDKSRQALADAEAAIQAGLAREVYKDSRITELEGTEIVLQDELASVRALLSTATTDCTRLKLENDTLITRLLEEKASMSAEMNKMNDIIEGLRAQLGSGSDAGLSGMFRGLLSAGGGGGGGGKHETRGGSSVGDDPLAPSWLADVVLPRNLAHEVKAHHSEVNSVVYSDTERVLFTGSSDHSVKVWDSASGKARTTLRGDQPIICVAVNTRLGLIAGAGVDRAVRVWDMHSGRPRSQVTGHSNKVHAVAYSGDGRLMVTGSTDRTIKVWEASSGKEIKTVRALSTCNSLDLSSDGTTIVSGHQVFLLRCGRHRRSLCGWGSWSGRQPVSHLLEWFTCSSLCECAAPTRPHTGTGFELHSSLQ